MVFVLIVATNLLDRDNFIRVKDSVVTIYEDRLVANDLIFEMARSIHEKELAAVLSDSIFYSQKNSKSNTEIIGLISRFELTKLTDKEGLVLNNLKGNFKKLTKAEEQYIQSGFNSEEELKEHIEEVKQNLYDLSKIQLNEGGRQMTISKRAISTVELFTQIELYVLILLAIIVQIIVMYKPKEES